MSTLPGAPSVTAVVVAHDGGRWLPLVLEALEAQTVPPHVVVAADTASVDTGADLLRASLGARRVVSLPAATGFGDAVRAALNSLDEVTDWVWLLHDDSVPAPDALASLLDAAAGAPAIGVVGPKIRSLAQPTVLLEVGVTLARSGRRETLLDRREYDQGQHDGNRDVLGVSTAGLLVRRRVWDRLGGLDPALPFLRDDVDFGWRARQAGARVRCATGAVVLHAEALARGERETGAVPRPYRTDRQHGAYVLLANLPLLLVPAALLSLVVGGLLRALAYLVGKRPGAAADELLALGAVLCRPDRLVRGRAARRRTRTRSSFTGVGYLAPRGAGRRLFAERAGSVLGVAHLALAGRRTRPDAPATSAPASGPTAEEDDELPGWGSGVLRRLLVRPSVGLLLGLALLAAVAARDLVGRGRLSGGALLPAPANSSSLWDTYLGAWHPVGLGSDVAAPAWLPVMAALGWLLGSPDRAVTVLLLGAVPLAGISAYGFLRCVVASVPLQVWGAATYALLPPVVGAVAAGRIGTCLVAVLLPVTALTLRRGLGPDGGGRALALGVLLLAVMTAFVPLVLPLAVAATLVVAPLLGWRGLRRVPLLVLGPAVLLVPWLPALVERPQRLLTEPGLGTKGLASLDLPGVAAVLLSPGGPGVPPLLLTVGLVVAALAAALRPDRRSAVLGGWGVALVGLAGALLVSWSALESAVAPAQSEVWPGAALLLGGAGLIVAAVVGAEGAADRVASRSFGWRQPAAALVALAALAAPVLLGGWWAWTGAGDPLHRNRAGVLPVFLVAQAAEPSRPRTLVVRQRADGRLAYTIVRRTSPRLGNVDVAHPLGQRASRRLDAAVADLASGRGGDAAAQLVPYAVRFVELVPPFDRDVARAVDGVPGVERLSRRAGRVLWRIEHPTGRARVVDASAPLSDDTGSPPATRVVRSEDVTVDASIPRGRPGRLLVLAERGDPRWRATLDGRALPATRYAGWAQAFALPARGGELDVRYEATERTVLLWVQAAAFLVLLVLMLPSLQPPGAGPAAEASAGRPGRAA